MVGLAITKAAMDAATRRASLENAVREGGERSETIEG